VLILITETQENAKKLGLFKKNPGLIPKTWAKNNMAHVFRLFFLKKKAFSNPGDNRCSYKAINSIALICSEMHFKLTI